MLSALCGEGIDLVGQAGDLSGRRVLVKDICRAGLLDQRDRLRQPLLSTLDIFLFDCCSHFADSRLHRRPDMKVS
jgi:hypothetical protein